MLLSWLVFFFFFSLLLFICCWVCSWAGLRWSKIDKYGVAVICHGSKQIIILWFIYLLDCWILDTYVAVCINPLRCYIFMHWCMFLGVSPTPICDQVGSILYTVSVYCNFARGVQMIPAARDAWHHFCSSLKFAEKEEKSKKKKKLLFKTFPNLDILTVPA